MKNFVRVCAVLLLIVYCIAPGLAEESDVYTIPYELDFVPQSVDIASDGTFLLAGMSGTPIYVPEMLSLNAEGEILWSHKQEGLEGNNLYRSAKYLNKDTILALRSVRDESGDISDEWIIQFIKYGKVTHQTKTMPGVSGIHCVVDGFFVYSRPDAQSACIEKFNAEGVSLWQIDWAERLHFGGIVSQGNSYVAYGSKETDGIAKPMSVVLAFDDKGNILWRHDSERYEEFSDAVWANGHLVLVGLTHPPFRTEAPDTVLGNVKHGFVREYDGNGQVWELVCLDTLPDDKSFADNRITSIIPVEDGYLVSQVIQYKVKMLFIDLRGNLIQAWDENDGNIVNPLEVSLHKVSKGIYLRISGYDGPFGDDEEGMPRPDLITVIKEVRMPT